MRCEECGRDVSDEIKFCKFCGTPVVRHETVKLQKEDSQRQDEGHLQCPSCGATVWKGDSFCPSCGYAFRSDGMRRGYDVGRSPIEASPRKESSLWKALAMIGIILALVAAALLIYFVVSGHFGQKEQDETGVLSQTEQTESADAEPALTDNAEPEPVESDSAAVSSNASAARTGEERYFIKNTSSTLNLRKLPQHDSALAGTVSDQSLLYFYGNVGQGLGSDGKVYDWYQVELNDGTTGWARSDLIREVYDDHVSSNTTNETVSSGSGRMQAETRYFIKNTSSTLNLRSLPKHESALAGTVSDQSVLFFFGEVGQGLGSDGKNHSWYKVMTENGSVGWARSDLLKEVSYDYVTSTPVSNDQTRIFTKNTSSTLNLRKLPQHDSDLVGTVSDQSRLYFYGEVGQGLGSDRKTHDWYKVTTENGTVGWARSDLLREVYG